DPKEADDLSGLAEGSNESSAAGSAKGSVKSAKSSKASRGSGGGSAAGDSVAGSSVASSYVGVVSGAFVASASVASASVSTIDQSVADSLVHLAASPSESSTAAEEEKEEDYYEQTKGKFRRVKWVDPKDVEEPEDVDLEMMRCYEDLTTSSYERECAYQAGFAMGGRGSTPSTAAVPSLHDLAHGSAHSGALTHYSRAYSDAFAQMGYDPPAPKFNSPAPTPTPDPHAAAQLLHNPRMRIATVSSGYRKANYFVREDLDTRIYFHQLVSSIGGRRRVHGPKGLREDGAGRRARVDGAARTGARGGQGLGPRLGNAEALRARRAHRFIVRCAVELGQVGRLGRPRIQLQLGAD
ncbi:hypothetical protein ACHAWF_000901, partial [Thalassiosira exigua]